MASQIEKTKDVLGKLVFLSPLIFLGVFLIVPIVLIAYYSFWSYDPTTYWIKPEYSTLGWEEIITTGRWYILLDTVRLIVMVALTSLLIAYPVSYYAAFIVPARYRTFALFIVIVPFLISYVIRTFAWRLILGKQGLVNSILMAVGAIPQGQPIEWLLFSDVSIFIGLLASYSPFVIFPIWLSLDRIEPSILEASTDLGGTSYRLFRHIILPLSKTGLAAGLILVASICLGESIADGLLGGAARVLAATMIRDVVGIFNFPLAFALSTILVIAMITLLILIRGSLRDIFRTIYR